MFKEFIDSSLELKVELELTESDIAKLTAASIGLGRAYDVQLFKACSTCGGLGQGEFKDCSDC